MIAIIAAMTKDHVIGKGLSLPWHIPEEIRLFRDTTLHKTVIMGRGTFEAYGDKPIPDRHNIIVSGTMGPISGIDVCKGLEEAISKAKTYGTDMFVIGGQNIFEQSIGIVDKMYISYIKKDYDGDKFFPAFDESDWTVESRQDYPEFERVIYSRKRAR